MLPAPFLPYRAAMNTYRTHHPNSMTTPAAAAIHERTIALEAQATVTVERAVAEVFASFADFRRHPDWVANLSKVALTTAEPIGVGSRFKSSEGPPPVGTARKVRMMVHFIRGLLSGSKSYSVAEITAFEPNHRIAWHAGIPHGTGFFNSVDWEVTFENAGGATRIEQRSWWSPQAPAARRMVAAAGPGGMDRSIGVNLARFKSFVESGKA